jgi:hypothetical protein
MMLQVCGAVKREVEIFKMKREKMMKNLEP